MRRIRTLGDQAVGAVRACNGVQRLARIVVRLVVRDRDGGRGGRGCESGSSSKDKGGDSSSELHYGYGETRVVTGVLKVVERV